MMIERDVQRFNPERLYHRKRVSAFLIDETMLQIGTEEAWLWVAVELIQFTNKSLDLHLKTQEYDSC